MSSTRVMQATNMDEFIFSGSNKSSRQKSSKNGHCFNANCNCCLWIGEQVTVVGLASADREKSSEKKTVRIFKRQASTPTCSALQATLTSLSPGATVGTVSSSDPRGLTVWYTIPDATYNQYFAVNPFTGVITTSANFNSGFLAGRTNLQFNVQSTNTAGGTCVTSVTVNVAGSTGLAPAFPPGVPLPPPPQAITSPCACGPGYYCYDNNCYLKYNPGITTNAVANTGFAGSGFGGGFGGGVSSGFRSPWGTSSCTGNGCYLNYPNLFYTAVNSTTGTSGLCFFGLCFNQTSTSSSVAATTVATVTTATVTATTASSATVTSATVLTSVTPIFASSSYLFITSSCAAGTTAGTVTASNAAGYTINYGSGNFAISSGGVITLSSALSAGVYSLTAVATSSSGQSRAVPVTVSAVCSTG